jgi:hypothetical protein
VRFALGVERWNWPQELPLVAAVSCVSALYGWVYDMGILVPTVLDRAVWIESSGDSRLARCSLAFFLLLGITIWVQQLATGSGVARAWCGPVVLVPWLWIHSRNYTSLSPSL